MDPRLYQAGIIAIPLESNLELGLKPEPNFLVFENQFGRTSTPFINLQTGEYEIVDAVTTVYKIVKREILKPNEFYQNENFIERILLPSENLNIPVDLLSIMFSHKRIKNNINLVNLALSKFNFRGDLEGLILKVDENVLDQILENNL